MFDYSSLTLAYYEFWPWFANTIIYFLDRYFGNVLDYVLPFNFRAYVWGTFLVLFVILPALFVLYIYITGKTRPVTWPRGRYRIDNG